MRSVSTGSFVYIHVHDLTATPPDLTGDRRADLGFVPFRNTGSGRTEAHVLDAATGYSTFAAHWATALGYADPTTSTFTIAG